MCLWECNGIAVAFFGQLIHLRAARIPQANGSCNLIKSFSGCIIMGSAYDLILSVIFDKNKMRMSTGYHHTQKWWFKVFVLYIVSRNMSLNMMHGH